MDYKNIVKVCAPGDIVFIDDGLISLKVTDRNSSSLTTGKGSPIVYVGGEGVIFSFVFWPYIS